MKLKVEATVVFEVYGALDYEDAYKKVNDSVGHCVPMFRNGKYAEMYIREVKSTKGVEDASKD